MATTQYIGARYVPLFYTAPDNSNDWQSGVEYEALTVVTYLSQSYISKIPVPASVGNPADNPTYWILTGAYNAQVEQYRQEVENYAADVTTLSQAFNDYIETDATFKDVPMLLMGNSWAAGAGATIGQGFTYYMQQFSGCDADFIQVRGGDFIATGNSDADYPGYTALGSLNLWAADQTAERLNSIKYVVYGGGLNDAFSTGNSYDAEFNAVDTWIKRVNVLMPNAKVYIIPLCGLGAMPNATHPRIYKAMNNAAAANGAIGNPYFITWFYGKLIYKTSENNTNHLNDAGYQLCAQYVLSLMRGWCGSVDSNPTSITPTVAGQDYSGCRLHNNGNLISICGSISYSAGTALVDGQVIGTIEYEAMRPSSVSVVPAFILYASDPTRQGFCALQIRANGEVVYRSQPGVTPTTNCQIYVSATYPLMNY